MVIRAFKYILILILFGFVTNCKSAKTVTSGNSNLSLSAKKVIANYNQNTTQFNTLAARVKIAIKEGEKEKNYTVNLRLKKDEKILITSTPISVVKALITPTRVSFYNKWENHYFDGDFEYLSKLLGTKLDFNKVQNMLLGQALFNLNTLNYKTQAYENSYLVQPKKQDPVFDILYLLNPQFYKLNSQQLTQGTKLLQVDYKNYQDVEQQIIPQQLSIFVVDSAKELKIDLEYKNVTLNEVLRFPYKIPKGYDEIVLE